MKTICEPRIITDRDPGAEYRYNVQLWHSYDGGKTFVYAGCGKFFKDLTAAGVYVAENRTPLPVFPVVTSERQQAYEQAAAQGDYIPMICGIHGRACRQMNDPEGANRALCDDCKLREFCAAADRMEYARS